MWMYGIHKILFSYVTWCFLIATIFVFGWFIFANAPRNRMHVFKQDLVGFWVALRHCRPSAKGAFANLAVTALLLGFFSGSASILTEMPWLLQGGAILLSVGLMYLICMPQQYTLEGTGPSKVLRGVHACACGVGTVLTLTIIAESAITIGHFVLIP